MKSPYRENEKKKETLSIDIVQESEKHTCTAKE